MNIIRNVAAVIVGLALGSIANMALVVIGHQVLPVPGSEMTDAHLMEPKHYIFPFLAHACGTFVAAIVAHVIAATHRTAMSLVVGVVFLAAGITVSFLLAAPVWFIALDLLVAYIPMACLGSRIGGSLRKDPSPAR